MWLVAFQSDDDQPDIERDVRPPVADPIALHGDWKPIQGSPHRRTMNTIPGVQTPEAREGC
jgi:hypothetical protein